MAVHLACELEGLLNPLPIVRDPENDQAEATSARVIVKFDECGSVEDSLLDSKLRYRPSNILSDIDQRYVGKATSRKFLPGADFPSGDSEMESSDEEFTGEIEGKTEKREEDDWFEGDDGNHILEKENDEHITKNDAVHKYDMEDSKLEVNHVQTFSQENVSKDVEKGQAIKNEMAIWDHLLEGRIKIQKALLMANQLPQPETLEAFKKEGTTEFVNALRTNCKALNLLMRSLVELQDEILNQFPETKFLIHGEKSNIDSYEELLNNEGDVEENGENLKLKVPPKCKIDINEYPDFMANRFTNFKMFRNNTLEKWYDRTKLSGKFGKAFGAFERSILSQIEGIMMDKERILRRTQIKRSLYRVFGKSNDSHSMTESGETKVVLPGGKSNSYIKDLDKNIFDDDDFYHQLLREVIEHKTSSMDPNDQVAMGRQWLAIQKLRNKIKKKVDTKASKGRRVRYHVHNKLVSFMAPIDHSTMNDDARTEIYQTFGDQVPRRNENRMQTNCVNF